MKQPYSTPSRRLGALLLSLIWLGGGATQALADDEPRWFQVEVVVFARADADDGIEQWPRNIQLRYPFNWEQLRDPQEAQALQPSQGVEQGLDEPTDPLGAPLEVDLERMPFYKLPSGERRLNNHARAMGRQSAYRILFHEAWRQPVLEQQQAPALLITGGDQFGEHYELEGSITLSVARYLHLHTRLWYTQFEPNFGQSRGTWPELPRRPNTLAPAETEPETDQWQRPWDNSRSSAWDTSLNTRSDQQNFLQEDYLPSRIVALTQQRRMRSRELHYIDHPLFGILVEITPYEHPDADED